MPNDSTSRSARRWTSTLLVLAVVALGGCGGDEAERDASSAGSIAQHRASAAESTAQHRASAESTAPLREPVNIWPNAEVPANLSGRGQQIAMVDTGLSREYLRQCPQCRTSVESGPAVDEIGHGTSVTAILSGLPRLGYPGVAPGAMVEVFPLARRQGQTVQSKQLVGAVDQAVARGFDVINISLGSQTPDARLAASIDGALEKGVTVVAAAGPEPEDLVLFPAAFPGVLSAASTTGHTHGSEQEATTPHDHHEHRTEASKVVKVPVDSFMLPYFDGSPSGLRLRRGADSSEAAAVVSGLVAVRRAAAADCGAVTLSAFIFKSLHDAADGRPLLSYLSNKCEE